MISVVATVWNEAATLQEFLDALFAQTWAADEIVIADGGSTDGTRELLQEAAMHHPGLRPLLLARSNRSVGRNVAIAAARGEIIAMTDAGSHAAPDWLERITRPLRADPEIALVAGYYRALPQGPLQQAIAAATVVPADRVDPNTFLPSSRSLAFRKEAWRRVGGYPEWADHNEDTLFALALRRAGCRMAFAPDAVVYWQPAGDLRRLFRQFYRYARGDAQARLFFPHYYKNVLWPLLASAEIAGRRSRLLRVVARSAATVYFGKQCVRAWRRTGSGRATALTPAVVLTLDWAHLLGYLHGILDRSRIHGNLRGENATPGGNGGKELP